MRGACERCVRAAITALGLACTPTPTQVPRDGGAEPAGVVPTTAAVVADAVPMTTAAAPAVVAPPPAPMMIEPCSTAGCWLARADEAEQLGNIDIAASDRGRAFVCEPTVARLNAWIDGLVAIGAIRRAHAGLAEMRTLAERRGDRALVAAVARRLAALPPVRDAAIAPPPLSAALKAAYAAEIEGRLDDAAAGFAAARTDEPYHLASAGRVAARRGEWAEARRLWSAARTGFHERGATLRVEPFKRTVARALRWRGDELGTSWTLELLDSDEYVGMLQLQAASAGARPRRLYFPDDSELLAFTADGRSFLRHEGEVIVEQDLLTGAMNRVVASPGMRAWTLATSGSGDDRRVLVGGESGVGLWDARGRLVRSFPLAGTTPTIMRVYTGRGTHHENIERDSPNWAVSLAMTARAEMMAIGASDGAIRVFDRGGELLTSLSYEWDADIPDPRGRRHEGPNEPLALGFAAGERLIAVYAHGDIVVWDLRSGAALQHHQGCSLAEAASFFDWPEVPGPARRLTRAEQIECGNTRVASISPDGTLAATGDGRRLRVRDVDTGRPRASLPKSNVYTSLLALSGSGVAGVSGLNELAVLRPGQELTRLAAPVASSITPWISEDGRLMHFEVGGQDYFWDVVARRRFEVTRGPAERVLAVSRDRRWAAVETAEAQEIREVATGKVVSTHAKDKAAAYAFMGRGHAVFEMVSFEGPNTLVIIGPNGERRTQVLADGLLAVSEDGRWMATRGTVYADPDGDGDQGEGVDRLRLWNLRTGRVVQTLEREPELAAFNREGSRLAYVTVLDREVSRLKLRVRATTGAPDVHELTVKGWPESVAFTPDGSEVLLLLEDGELIRWRWATGARRTLAQRSWVMTTSALLAEDGKTLLLPGYDAVQVRTNDREMRRIGTLFALQSGGWMVVSRSGAMDGSDDAVDHLVTWVEHGDETLVFDGWLGWDGAHVPGTAARVLAGEDMAPPVLIRPPPPPEQGPED